MWFKLCDHSHSHPKVVEAGNAAWGLFCRLGSWSSEKGTDGIVPLAVVRMFETPNSDEAARLSAVGLLEALDSRSACLHDFLKYNPTAAEVAKLRRKRADAGRRGGKRSGEVRRTMVEISVLDLEQERSKPRSKCLSKHEAKTNPDPDPEEEITLAAALPQDHQRARGGDPAPGSSIFSNLLKKTGGARG